MGLFDKVARILHENTEDTKNVAASTTPAKKSEPTSPPLDSEARKAYEQGFDCYRKGEYEEAARLYRISADLGFFRAQYSLALLYSEGLGVEKDLDAAELWAQKAADQGYEAAAKLVKDLQEKRSTSSDALALGINFYEQENYEQAVRHFRTAANADHADAQTCLAACYATGEGVEKDLDTAELWAKRALDSGDEQAAELLDAIHEEQRDEAFELGVSCCEQGDYTQAFQYFHTAAQLGLPNAQFNLALCYFKGEGVEQNLDMATLWAKRASEQGFEAAAELLELLKAAKAHPFDLGVACYEKGHYTQAVQHFRTAAEQGIAEAQFNLALCYSQGKGVEESQSEAARWYRAAAEQGDQKAAEALARLRKKEAAEAFNLGLACHEKGDYVQATQQFRTAAELGLTTAQCRLALCYFEGEGVEQDLDMAILWVERASKQGLESAAELLKLLKAAKEHPFDLGVACLKQEDFVQAARLFRIAAKQGDAKAQFNLALCYQQGLGVEQNDSEAFHWYHEAAEQGIADAQFCLALCYAQGIGEEKNLSEAVRWFRAAAEQGIADAQFNLALCYSQGKGVEENQSEAVRWFRAAAEQGYVGAQFNLALCYAQGEGVEKDLDMAITWAERAHEQDYEDAKELLFILKLQREKEKPHFLIAAERGDANAQFALALRYADGDGVEQDQSKAVHWYQKAAEQGHAKAQFNLAVRYENGNGIERDQTKAVRWYLKAAQQGHSGAQFNLALCYRDGDGVQEDQWKASHWFHMAAEQGDAVAQFNLAVRYEEGRGIHQDQSKAIRWYRTAAYQGYANAQNNLAICYEQGRGVKQDQSEAVRWYRAAAEQGYASAQFNLALCYINGDGVEPNMPEAIHWYIKAAEQGHTTAQFNLAVRYENGNGVEKNQSEAVRWYRAAAQQGYASAQYNLSICYRDGDGVAVDLDTAELWAQKAVEQGYESAPKLLEGIRQRKSR